VQRDADGHETRSQFAANFTNPGQSQLRAGANATLTPGAARVSNAANLVAPRELWQLAVMLGLALLVIEWWAFQRQ
jgi:hypothetical protein